MANQHFHNIAYKADSRKELLSAINDFLDDSIVLPPGDWERQALLPIEEIKAKSEMIKKRKENALKKAQEAQGIEEKPLLVTGENFLCLYLFDQSTSKYCPLYTIYHYRWWRW